MLQKNGEHMNSIFSKIIRGEIPSHRVLETDRHVAFLDIRPVAQGHTLVVPKQEIDYLFDLDDELLAETMRVAKRVAKALDRAFSPIRTGVIVEGLEVPHAHVHLIPIHRHGQPFSLSAGRPAEPGELEAVAHAIRDCLGSEERP